MNATKYSKSWKDLKDRKSFQQIEDRDLERLLAAKDFFLFLLFLLFWLSLDSWTLPL